MNAQQIQAARFDEINDATGFAGGSKFTSEQQVREYFTVAAMREMVNVPEGELPDQGTLDEYAADVLENRWHCDF